MKHETLYRLACAAGNAAADRMNPAPMTVQRHAISMNDSSPIIEEWHVPEGVCGFAWVMIKGNTSFGRWAKKQGHAHKGYRSGLSIWVRQFGQCYEKKVAYAAAFANALNVNDVVAHAQDRLD